MQEKLYVLLDLQLFGEGDGGPADSRLATAEGDKDVDPYEGVSFGVQGADRKEEDEVRAAGVSDADATESEFEEAIKGKYKDAFGKRVAKTVQERLKASKQTVDNYNKLVPVLQTLADKYGVDPNDVDGLVNKINEDNYYYEDEAIERGVSPEELRAEKQRQRETENLRKENEELKRAKQADEQYGKWIEEAEAMKEFYPNFDLRAEVTNEKFVKMLNMGESVRDAYEYAHKDEIFPQLFKHAENRGEQKVRNSVIANQTRFRENGGTSRTASANRSDVNSLTDSDMDEVLKRIQRGERITFG